jgi:hypothetical protein
MIRRSLIPLALAALLAVALVAVASAASTTKRKSKTANVAAHKTRIVTVAYPDALKFGGSKYKCSASVTDGDASKVKKNDSTAKSVAAVEEVAAGRMFRFREDIETALGTEKRAHGGNPAHLVALVEALHFDDLDEGDELRGLADALKQFADPGPTASAAGAV